MVRFALIGAVALGVFWIYSIVDCALSDGLRVRALPKWAWVLIVVLLPLIGALLWFGFGRPRKEAAAGMRGRGYGPDDDPAFLQHLAKEQAEEKRIHKLEQELADLDNEKLDGPTKGAAQPKKDAAPSQRAAQPNRPKKSGDDPTGRRNG